MPIKAVLLPLPALQIGDLLLVLDLALAAYIGEGHDICMHRRDDQAEVGDVPVRNVARAEVVVDLGARSGGGGGGGGGGERREEGDDSRDEVGLACV